MIYSTSFIHKACVLFLISSILLLCSTMAKAESILIRTKSGVEGQGWLFGAQTGEKCWIVVPVHVVASPESGKLEPFYFFDR